MRVGGVRQWLGKVLKELAAIAQEAGPLGPEPLRIEAHEARFGSGAGVQFTHGSVQRVHRGRQGEIAGSVEVKRDIRSGDAIGRQRRCAVA
jgi:hypothetical protein